MSLFDEGDRRVSLLERLLAHARVTARHAVYYGDGRDFYDVRGRVAHESLFNVADGQFRCPGTQQGYSPFSTWTRGLAWVLLGFAEELEFVETLGPDALVPFGGRDEVMAWMLRAAQATADFYIESTPPDGIPYWDTGAPGLVALDLGRPADPFNDHEPVDASAAAIAAQGLLRLARFLAGRGREAEAGRYGQAGLVVTRTLLATPVPLGGRGAPGTAAALRLPPSERLGLRAPGPEGPLRRVEPVGRLPPPRARPLRAAPGHGRSVLPVLRAVRPR